MHVFVVHVLSVATENTWYHGTTFEKGRRREKKTQINQCYMKKK
jgi:hypothetical protein